MTIALFHHGVLATDSRGISGIGESGELHYEMKKLFVHEVEGKKRLAVAAVGDAIDAEIVDYVIKILYNHIEVMEETDKSNLEIIPFLLEEPGKGKLENLYIISRRYRYVIADGHLRKLRDTGPWFAGSGIFFAKTAVFAFGASAVQAVEKAIELDPLCGGSVHSIAQKELTLIPVPRKKKVKENG